MGTAASHQPLCSSLPRPVGVSLYPPTENGFPKLNSVKPGTLNTSQNSGFRSVVIAQNNRNNSAKKEVVECTPEDDGYRWRKYGRKSVKGNQFPRSYYKCTQPNCQVKKQVETIMVRGKPEVHTTYKGEHNHEAPQVTRLNAQDQLSFKNSVMTEFLHSEGKFNGRMLSSSSPTPQSRSLSNSNGAIETVKAGLMATHSPKLSQLAALVASDLDSLIKNTNSSVSNGSDEEMDIDTRAHVPNPMPITTRTNSTRASRLSTNSEKISLPRKRTLNQSSPAITIKSEYSYPSTSTNVEGLFRVKNERNTKNSTDTVPTSESESAGEGNLADFSDSNEGSTQTTSVTDDSFTHSPSFFPNLASSGPSSTLTLSSSGSPLSTSSNSPLLSERSTKTTNNAVPRLVVETNANVDFLDDGYHWRKYGQKNVKGSRYPRSYYKCTEKNCPVKKQVEQSGNTMINTYEGTHTHKAPGLDDNLKKRRKRRRTDCSDGTAT